MKLTAVFSALLLFACAGLGAAQAQAPALDVHRDIVYATGGGVPLHLDIYAPKSAMPLPVVMWIHGGGWKAGDKNDHTFFNITNLGFALVVIDYRLSQQAIFPAQIYDCKASVRWVRANAAAYHLNPDKIGVVGASAGGHLVALLGTTNNNPQVEGDEGPKGVSSAVQCVVDYFGPTDFPTIEKQATQQQNAILDPMLDQLFGGPVPQKADLAQMASPLHFVDVKASPFLIIHGDQDTIIPLQQSIDLDAALKKAGVYSDLHVIKGGAHGYVDPQKYDPAAYDATIAFLKKYLGSS